MWTSEYVEPEICGFYHVLPPFFPVMNVGSGLGLSRIGMRVMKAVLFYHHTNNFPEGPKGGKMSSISYLKRRKIKELWSDISKIDHL